MKTQVLSVYFLKQKADLREKIIRTKLLKWCYQFSPIVALDTNSCTLFEDPDSAAPLYSGVNLDISGSTRLFSDQALLIRKIESGLREQGFYCRLVIAPTLGAAWALSRFREERAFIVQKEELKAALCTLPIAALRIEKKTIESLHELNILYIKELLRIPHSELLSRFNREISLRINQALGIEIEALAATRFTPALRKTRVFRETISDTRALQETSEALLTSLLAELKQKTKKPLTLTIETKAANKPVQFKNIYLSVASMNKKHLFSLIEQHIESLQINALHPQDGIEYIGISAAETQTIQAKQAAEVKENASSALGELLDTLYHRLGQRSVKQVTCYSSHIPEKAFAYTPFQNGNGSTHHRAHHSPLEMVESQRPSLLFHTPQLVKAMNVLPDGCPFSLTWRGAIHRITSGIGPERICPAWWAKEDSRLGEMRDYFRVQIDCGSWLWVFREIESSRWFIHGMWC
jgi:protein ImuB